MVEASRGYASGVTTPRTAARTAQRSTVFRTLARIGFVVLGVVHGVIGAIAISISGGAAGDADQDAAMEQIRQTPLGVVLLWVIAAGLIALAAWQIAEAILEQDADAKRKWGYRVKYLGTALAYLALAGTAIATVLRARSGSDSTLSAQLLATPGGVFLLAAIGVIVAAIGIAFIIRGFTKGFEKHLDLPAGNAGRGIVAFGVVGYVAKGIAVAVTGVLFVAASVTHDAESAGGLDDALHTLAELPFGTVILWVVGAGLIIYGLFCLARARYARM